MELQAHAPRRTDGAPSRTSLGRPSHRRLTQCKSHSFMHKRMSLQPPQPWAYSFKRNRYDGCTRNAVPAGHLCREYPMRGENSNHTAARRWH
jgi:hypothetical protein